MRPVHMFASLVPLPVIIDGAGWYETRQGERVHIRSSTNSPTSFGCIGRYEGGPCDGWHRSGRLYFTVKSMNDIIRKIEEA
jgi:hypothetical protein